MLVRVPCLGLVVAALLAVPAQRLLAQVAAADLARAPADAQRFTVLNASGTNGRAAFWTAPDGTRWSRESVVLRGQVWEVDEAVRLGDDGLPASVTIRGVTPSGDAAESFAVTAGRATWRSQIDAGDAPYVSAALYIAQGGTWSQSSQLLLEALLAAPDRSLALLPGGRGRAERLTEAVVGDGALRQKVVAWSIIGLSSTPFPLWATQDGRFFGFVGGVAILPVGYEGELTKLQTAQADADAAKSPLTRQALLKTPDGALAFTHVRAFVRGRRFEADQTVVIDDGLIVAVGPSSATPVPAGARVIDGAGKTLVPGLWDSHQHIESDYSGPFLLALGITSVRDPGNRSELTVDRARRRALGQLLMPHVHASLLLDGVGANTAQLGKAVASLDEAIAAIREAARNGYVAVKFYGTFEPAWVEASAAEAHRLGLHVHGHVPAGMRPSQAIAAGYDELTHIYFVMMEAMPDDVVATSNGINRFNGSGRFAKDVDLSAAPIKALVDLMARRGTVVDPTLVVVESIFVPENGDLSPAYAPFVGTLPPATERGFREGGFAVPHGLSRDDFRKSEAKMVALLAALHRAGVPIVAGTDGSGLELVRELELYVDAGFTTSEALAAATLAAARNVGVDARTGSIDVGKAADLVLVEGDPSLRIGDLRNTRLVVMDGKVMDADALRAAAGFSGPPRPR